MSEILYKCGTLKKILNHTDYGLFNFDLLELNKKNEPLNEYFKRRTKQIRLYYLL